MPRAVTAILLSLMIHACAHTTATRVRYDDVETPGIRVYDPMLLMVVTCTSTEIVAVPDFERAYAVQFEAHLAHNDFSMELQEGMLVELASELDTTGLLALIQELGEEALDSAGELGALGAAIGGTLPGLEGVWRLEVDPQSGRLRGLIPIVRTSERCAD